MKRPTSTKPQSHKKLDGRLVFTVVSMCLTLAMLVASGTAWLTTNRKANSNGVQMTVKSTSNLVISKTLLGVNSATPNFEVTFDANDATYSPATHIYSMDEEEFGETGLKYLSNEADTDPATGFVPDDGASLVDVPYSSTNTSDFYRDYTVYIASAGNKLENYDLIAKIGTPTNLASLPDTAKALSIDFYLGSVSYDNYCSTLNLAELDNEMNDGETELESVYILYGEDIPNAQGTPLCILLRVYFDGALIKDDGDAFIRSEDVTTDMFEFGLEFSATEHTDIF